MSDTSLDSTLAGITPWLSTLVAAMGAIGVMFGGVLLIKALMDPYRGSFSSAFTMIVVGGALSVGGMVMPRMLGQKTEEASGGPSDGSTEQTATPSATPTPTPEQTPSPSAEPADPISLPKIENPETLWIIPVAIIVLFVGYLLLKRLVLDVRKVRKNKAELAAREAKLDAKWEEVTHRHTALKKRYLDAETDWDMLFNLPALTDVSVPATAAMVTAMHAAADADSERPNSVDEDTDLSTLAYPRAVSAFAVAWDVALRNARKIGQRGIPDEERKTIKRIRNLLAMAENSGASENERTMAYTQAHSLIKELRSIQVPEKALLGIEERKRQMIEA